MDDLQSRVEDLVRRAWVEDLGLRGCGLWFAVNSKYKTHSCYRATSSHFRAQRLIIWIVDLGYRAREVWMKSRVSHSGNRFYVSGYVTLG